jgi:hypothetical protein
MYKMNKMNKINFLHCDAMIYITEIMLKVALITINQAKHLPSLRSQAGGDPRWPQPS